MNPRQLGAPIAILVLAVLASLVSSVPDSAKYIPQLFVLVGVGGAVISAYVAIAGPKGASFGPVLNALKAAQKGRVPELPEGAPPELGAVYEEVGRLAEKNEETKEQQAELRDQNKSLARELEQLKDKNRELAASVDKLSDRQQSAQADVQTLRAREQDLLSQLDRERRDLAAQVEREREARAALEKERVALEKRVSELAEHQGIKVDFNTVFDDVRRASRGERVRSPANAAAELQRFYGDLADLASQVQDEVVADKHQRAESSQVATQIDDSLPRLQDGIEAMIQSTEQATTYIKEMTTALSNIAQSIEALASSAEESSSSILQMTATNDEVAENIGELATSVRETVSSIEEMAYSIREVAKNVDALSLTAEETSSSMNEMDVSIDQVQSNANETARLSEEVATDAEKGAEAILKTIGEIYRIKESSQEAVSVMSNLGFRIEAIGQILQVIDDVAEQTNLLALNAAIIAAQAGEHGKGFAVVADEIKDLAERAGGSTKEIAELIKTIQAESKNAISAVERGAHIVDRGVEVSNEAERALKKILESSQKSTNMVRAIARATVEQAKGSKQVTDAIGRIAETVQQIAAATAEQARGSELIMKSAEKMRTITQHVERSSQEQARGGRQITTAIEAISNGVNSLNATQRAQTRGGEQLIEVSKRIEEAARQQAQSVQRLHQLSEKLRRSLSA
jgi:methyl-accepting chemotaxis protein